MSGRMPRPKSENDRQTSVYLPQDWLDQIDELARAMSSPGIEVTKAQVMRSAMRRGLDAMMAERAAAERPSHHAAKKR